MTTQSHAAERMSSLRGAAGKVVSAGDAVQLIRDGDTLATGGVIGIGLGENQAEDGGFKRPFPSRWHPERAARRA